ncbi:hypothetical protein ACHAQA_007439 [Verticillium albo-atrum]
MPNLDRIQPYAHHAYEILEDVESPEDYEPGGFHPIRIGDVFRDGRYRIIHKLGYGGYSTIWLAKDEQSDRYVAIKVAAADAPLADDENRILARIINSPVAMPPQGRQYIPPLLDHFTISGPNGNHACLVTTPARLSLRHAKDDYSWPSLCPVGFRVIAAQLIEAVAHVHARGVVHGDIHPGNVLLQLPETFHAMSPDEIYQRHGPPDLQPIKRRDGQPLAPGMPSHVVTPIWLGRGKQQATLSDAKIMLTDFGEAYVPAETSRTISKSPVSYAPPESRFVDATHTQPLSFPADVWSLACTLWEVLGEKPLFEPWVATDDDVLAGQVDLVGKLPVAWWDSWKARGDYFTEDGELDVTARRRQYDSTRHSWDDCLDRCIRQPRQRDGMEAMSGPEEQALLAMFKSMLKFQPEDRASAEEVTRSAWMKQWALPDLELARREWNEPATVDKKRST